MESNVVLILTGTITPQNSGYKDFCKHIPASYLDRFINSVMKQFSNLKGSRFAGNYARDFMSTGTTFFAFTPDLYDDILSIHEDILNNYVEIAIMNFIHRQFKKDENSIVLFNRPLFVSGRSGHYGHVYDDPKWKKPLRYVRKGQKLLEWHLITKRKFRKSL